MKKLLFATLIVCLWVVAVPESLLSQSGRPWKAHDQSRPRPVVVTPGDSKGVHAPPSDAVVLFDGTNLDAWKSVRGGEAPWKVENGYFEVVGGSRDIMTRESFGDVQLHLEWASPADARGNGQGRANSGVFFWENMRSRF